MLALVGLLVVPLSLLRFWFWVVDAIREEARSLERERCAVELEREAGRLNLKSEASPAAAMVLRHGAELLRQGEEASS